VTLASNVIAMVWISSDDVAAVAAKGFRVIHAASDFFYLVRYISGFNLDIFNANSHRRTVEEEDGSVKTLLATAGVTRSRHGRRPIHSTLLPT